MHPHRKEERREKIEKLLESFGAFRRTMVHRPVKGHAPHITPSQWGVIMLVGHGSVSSVKDVANALRISSSAATQLIDGLVASGHLQKKPDPKDSRAVSLTLSKKTKKNLEDMKKKRIQQMLTMFEVLNDKELNQYCALSEKLSQRFLRA